MSQSSILNVEKVTKQFGGLTAVDDVTISLEEGKIYSLIGPNGAGKTTLFNLITGYLDPTSGSVSFNGEDITNLEPHEINKKGIARTFQVVRPFEGMTVKENVKVGAYFGQSKRERSVEEITDDVLTVCNLDELADKQANALSIGNAKRLEVAKAYATNPGLLLADEPSAGLNPTESKTLIGILEDIRDSGTTVMIVEHDMDTVMAISEHIFVLDNGKLISNGPPEYVANDQKVIDAYLGTDSESDEFGSNKSGGSA